MGPLPFYDALPGADLVHAGLCDLARGIESVPSLLVAIGAERLRRCGIQLSAALPLSPERRLYDRLAQKDPDSAHSRYNALIRRLVSYERALEGTAQVPAMRRSVTRERIARFMREMGRAAVTETRIYFTGGATAVLLGWRASAVGIDIELEPEEDHLLRAIPRLKETLEVNLELASPGDFIPEIPGWRERSAAIGREGRIAFFHYDLTAQALAKIERGHAQDRLDVQELLHRGLVTPEELLARFAEIEPFLYRYPALDPATFRRAVESTARGAEPP